MHKQYSPLKAAQQGVVLIEAMIAIVIFAFGVLGIVGLQAAMVKNTSEAKYRSEASYIAQQYIGALWTGDPNLLSNNGLVGTVTDISNLLPNGSLTINQPNLGQIQVIITWQDPGDTQNQIHNYTTYTNISGS